MNRNNANITKAEKAKKKSNKVGKTAGVDKRSYVLGDEVRVPNSFAAKVDELERTTGLCLDIDATVGIFEQLQLKPQSQFLRSVDAQLTDAYMNVLENVLLLAAVFIKTKDSVILTSATMLFAKNYVGKSCISKVTEYISKFCVYSLTVTDYGEAPEPQSFVFEDVMSNFKNLRHSALFRKMNNLISLVITLGFIDPICFSIKGVTVFSNNGMNSMDSSENFFDYCLDLFEYFFRSVNSLFGGEQFDFMVDELTKIDQDIIHLQSYINSIALGDYEERTGNTIFYYQETLMKTMNTLRTLIAGSKSKPHTVFLNGKMAIVSKLMVTFEQCCPLDGLRMAPFSMCVFGKSSVGKTSVMQMLSIAVLKGNGFPCEGKNLCTIQSNDKFYSTYRADTTCVFLDDIANTRAEKAVVNPADLIVSLVNNVTYYAPKAVAEEKGKIKVQPKVVTVTTNVKELESTIWSNEPLSVLRRLNLHLTVSVKPQFARNGKLASSQFDERNRNMYATLGILDVWDILVERIVPTEAALIGGAEGYKFEIIHGPKNKFWNMPDLIRFAIGMSERHFTQQKLLVANMTELGARMPIVKGGFESDVLRDLSIAETLGKSTVLEKENPLSRLEQIKKTFLPAGIVVDKIFNKLKQDTIKKVVHGIERTCIVEDVGEEKFEEEIEDGVTPGPQSSISSLVKQHCIAIVFDYVVRAAQNFFSYGVEDFWIKYFSQKEVVALLPLAYQKIINSHRHYLDVVNFTKVEKKLYPWVVYLCPSQYFWLFESPGGQSVVAALIIMFFRCVISDVTRFTLPFAIFAVMLAFASGLLFRVMLIRCYIWEIYRDLYEAKLGVIISRATASQIRRYGKTILVSGVSLSAGLMFIYGIRSLLRISRMSVQGNLQPTSGEDVKRRDEEANVWSKKSEPFSTSLDTVTFTAEQLVNKVAKNSLHAVQIDDNRKSDVSILMLDSNIALCPFHFFL